MSGTKHEPLLVSHERIRHECPYEDHTHPMSQAWEHGGEVIRGIYERDRSSLLERIQELEKAGKEMRDHLEILAEGWMADDAMQAAKYPMSLVDAWDALHPKESSKDQIK